METILTIKNKDIYLQEGNRMLKIWTKFETWKRCEDGATAIEYGLIAAGIAVAISAVVFVFGDNLAAMFGDMADTIGNAGAS